MSDPHYLLRPVNPLFIVFTLFAALLFNFLPWGRHLWVPDLLALTLVFWNIHQPRKVGIGIAFALGLLMDVHDAALLGEHALAYTLLSYFAITIHRRVLWLTIGAQTMHVWPLFLLAQIIPVCIRLLMGAGMPGWSLWLASALEAALWPIATFLLLAPQRRPEDVDQDRPI